MSRITGDLHVGGTLTADTFNLPTGSVSNNSIASTAAILRTKLAQEGLVKFTIPMASHRVHDDLASLLPGAAANDDLGILGDTFATDSPSIQTGDLKAAGATTRYSRFQFQMPAEYDPGESVKIRAHAGMITTVADTSATIDFETYKTNQETGIGSDLVTTSAVSINSLTFADIDFDLTSAGLNPGDELDIRMTIAVNDGATATAVIGCVGWLAILLDIRG